MVEGSALAGLLGPLLGEGAGRGIGLIFVLVGVLIGLYALVGCLNPRILNIEAELPDYVATEPGGNE